MVAEARDFLGMYGLRPLGGSLDSEDDEEREHRVAARDARAALNASRLAEPPTREQIRKAMSGAGSSAVERVQSITVDDADSAPARPAAAHSASSRSTSSRTGSSRTATRSARHTAAPAKDVDLKTLESRVTSLLDKLTTIDAQISEKEKTGGLAARARIKDLEKQRTTVLHTLAALEKARRLQTG